MDTYLGHLPSPFMDTYLGHLPSPFMDTYCHGHLSWTPTFSILGHLPISLYLEYPFRDTYICILLSLSFIKV